MRCRINIAGVMDGMTVVALPIPIITQGVAVFNVAGNFGLLRANDLLARLGWDLDQDLFIPRFDVQSAALTAAYADQTPVQGGFIVAGAAGDEPAFMPPPGVSLFLPPPGGQPPPTGLRQLYLPSRGALGGFIVGGMGPLPGPYQFDFTPEVITENSDQLLASCCFGSRANDQLDPPAPDGPCLVTEVDPDGFDGGAGATLTVTFSEPIPDMGVFQIGFYQMGVLIERFPIDSTAIDGLSADVIVPSSALPSGTYEIALVQVTGGDPETVEPVCGPGPTSVSVTAV